MSSLKCIQMMSCAAVVFLIFAGLISCSTVSEVPVQSRPGTTTTIILLRHAERIKNGDRDKTGSYLRSEGRVRAQALVDAVGDMDVTAIYSPDLGRNLETVQPLADHLGLKVNIIQKSRLSNTPRLANEFVEEVLSEHAGGVVVWVGNASAPVGSLGGNLQRIYQRLGGTGKPPVRYGDLYIILVPDKGPVRITESRFGD